MEVETWAALFALCMIAASLSALGGVAKYTSDVAADRKEWTKFVDHRLPDMLESVANGANHNATALAQAAKKMATADAGKLVASEADKRRLDVEALTARTTDLRTDLDRHVAAAAANFRKWRAAPAVKKGRAR